MLASAMARKTKQTGQSPGADAEKDGTTSTPQAPNVDSSAQAFAAKAKDLDALREAVVDAAGVGAGLWLSYLFLFFYLFIAAGAVTHHDFLFENPVKLPFLGVELPLLGFFVLGPLIFLILHAYVLLHFAMLADKVGVFHSELQAQIADEDTRTRLRRQLPSNIFVQYLAGPDEVRTGIMGFMLRLIALITLVIFPIALLVFFQLQFLPYHNEPIAWWLRITVLLDILLLWTLWPSIARGQTSWISWHDFHRPRIIAVLLASLVPLLLVFSIATFPGEWLHSNLPSLRLVPTMPSPSSDSRDQTQPSLEERWRRVVEFVKSLEWISLHKMLVAGNVDLIAGKPISLWSNRLVLPDIDVTDHPSSGSDDESGTSRETLSLRGRRLEGAVLKDSNLRKVDLTGARLEGAKLRGVYLREANLSCDRREDKKIEEECAQLQGADLLFAQLQGANLYKAQLQGADLRWANLESADMRGAQLQGADLRWAKLQGADLPGAQLQGADLRGAQLQGADLDNATLQGADLRGAHLQATKLHGVKLQGADLTGVEVWLASFPDSLLQQSPELPAPIGLPETSPLTPEVWDELKKQLRTSISDGQLSERSKDDLDPILGDDAPDWADKDRWTRYIDETKMKTKEPSPDALAQYLAGLACSNSGTAEGLARRAMAYSKAAANIYYAKPLAEALLNLSCEGAKGLTDDTRARLKVFVSALARQ